jgi:hypothetical protein
MSRINLNKKIKGSAMLYAISIAVLLSLLSSSLIGYSYFSNLQFFYYNEVNQTQLNAQSGLNILLSGSDEVPLNSEKEIDLFNAGKDSVFLKRTAWGVFETATVRAHSKHSHTDLNVLIGTGVDTTEKKSLYLSDLDRPLAVCGNTLIKGIAYLPKSGVKNAYIEGESFTGKKIIDGITKTSSKSVPKFNEQLTKSLTELLNKNIPESDSVFNLANNEMPDSLKNSFTDKTIFVTSTESIDIRDQHYSGNICFISDKGIKIGKKAQLKDVIVIAPGIEVEEGFEGTIQAFASDSIKINKKVKLNYPSALGVLRTNRSKANVFISIKEDAEISGSVFAWQDPESSNVTNQVHIAIDKGVIVRGTVYSSVSADLKGTIYGSLTCAKIILTTPSSVYENHLLDATIDATKLSNYYAGMISESQKGGKKIVKWLY